MKRAWTPELLDAARRELAPGPRPPIRGRKVRGRLAIAVANPSLRRAFVQELAEFVAMMRENGHAGTTRTSYSSMDSFFSCFCVETGIDYEAFGASEAKGGLSEADEDVVLAMFGVYVVKYPRIEKEANTGDYAASCISAVRSACEKRHGRRPGTDARRTTMLALVLKGLRKLYPSGARLRHPILQQHLRLVRDHLDLAGNQFHRTLWAFWLTCWQGVCRCGDLIRSKGDRRAAGNWSPKRDLHRGSMRSELVQPPRGESYVRITLRMKPDKTHTVGDVVQEKTFPVDQDPFALSAGAAQAAMLAGDPLGPDEDPEFAPFFRDPRPGRNGAELTYQVATDELRAALHAAGLGWLATGGHSLRIGGATAVANDPSGGEMMAMFMGCWVSKAMHKYPWALRDRVDATSFAMARGEGGELAVRPGPVATYARGA